MANQNAPHRAVAGQRSLNDDHRPAFAQCEAVTAWNWYTDGKPDPQKSMMPAGDGPLVLESGTACLNALVVSGGSAEIIDPKLTLSGWGCSDFSCKGAGILAKDGAEVTVRGAEIVTHGATRCATTATTGATLRVYDSRLETYGGPLPPDYVPVIGPGMMEPPAPLGLGGNCRTHLSMDGSSTYFYNCDIFAEAWGAVSTDASGGWLYTEVNDSRITVAGNGYATYADNGCHVVFNRCAIQTGNMAVIQDGNSSVRFYDTTAECGGCGMMLHGGMEDLADIGIILWEGGSLRTEQQGILCKSTNVDIYFKNAVLESALGVLAETKLTDDRMYFTRRTCGPACYGVQFTFEAMDLKGDFLMGDPERPQHLNLVNTRLIGAIAGDPVLTLTEGAVWTAAADSYVTLSGEVLPDQLDALERCVIRAKRGPGCSLPCGETALPSGGTLLILE